ncbi:MAG: transcriptional regulator, partial [Candidatus Thermoplasmatota archaeon]|nr:transcriptional regulator [Candidatus Thermoplasmatota archaeon]
MGKKDFRKERKDLYSPKAGISEVDVPRMRFIAITREGTIDNERAQEAAEILFDLSYAVKMSLAGGTQPCGYHDYEIMP